MPNSEKYEELTGKYVCLEPEQEYRSYPNHYMRQNLIAELGVGA